MPPSSTPQPRHPSAPYKHTATVLCIEQCLHALPAITCPQVRDIIRTNLGSVMLALLGPVHRFKLWIMR